MKKLIFFILGCIIVVSISIAAVETVFALNVGTQGGVQVEPEINTNTPKGKALQYLKAGSASAGFTEAPEDPRVIAARVVKVFLGVVGSIFVYLFVYSGYLLLSAQGEEDKVSTARKTMTGAVIGLFITLLAFGITYFVGKASQEITEVNGPLVPQKYGPQ